jgi:hypothetical protein
MEKLKIQVVFEKTRTGWSAYAVNHPAFTTGENYQETRTNMVEALNLLFENKTVIEGDLEIREVNYE